MFELGKERRRLRRGTRAFAREVEVGDARIFVDHGFQWDGANNVWLTRARGAFVMKAGPVFDIRPRSFLARVAGIQGGEPSGDPCFDDFFSVRTANPEDTWTALTTRARWLLAGSFDDARLVSDGRMVTLWREGDFGRELDADAAIEVVSEIVHFRAEAMVALWRLPTAVPYAPEGTWDDRDGPGVVLHVPTPVLVEPAPGPRGPITIARAACGRVLPRFSVVVDACGGLSGATNWLPRGLAEQVPGIGESELSCDGSTVMLSWRRLEVDRERLSTGARLVGALASSQSQGCYR